MSKVRMQTRKDTYTFDYEAPIEFQRMQEKIFWTAKEIDVNKDIQDLRVNMTEAERHGVITTLKLFTLYELIAGKDYWLGRVMRMFPRPDIERMAVFNGMMEICVHAPFYNQINEALLLNTDAFYSDYVNDPLLAERMKFIEKTVCHEDDLTSIGTFSLVEGAILYSSFAFLKHFQARGKNKLLNVVRGINFSVRDENLHFESGAWLFKQLMKEKLDAGLMSSQEVPIIALRISAAATEIIAHEHRIIDMIFEKGDMDGIDKDDLKMFVISRVNLCLEKIGVPSFHKPVEDNVIASWFYKDINLVQFHDFFTGIGNSYNRDYDQSKFIW